VKQCSCESKPLLILDAKFLFPMSGSPDQRHQLRQSNVDQCLRNLRFRELVGR
jgi:hypothetical protein